MKLHGELDHPTPVTLIHRPATQTSRWVACGRRGRREPASWLRTVLRHPRQVAGDRVLRLEGRALSHRVASTARRVLTQGGGGGQWAHRPRQLPTVAAIVRWVFERVVPSGHRRRAEVGPASAVVGGATVPSKLHVGVGRVSAAGPEVRSAVGVRGGHGSFAAHVLRRGRLGPVGLRAVIRPCPATRHHLRAGSPTPKLAWFGLSRIPVPVAIVPSPATPVTWSAKPVPVPVVWPAPRVQPHIVVSKRVHTRSHGWASTLIQAFHVIAVCAWVALISMLVRHFLCELGHMILHGRPTVLWIHVQVSAVVEWPITALVVPIVVWSWCLGAILGGSFWARFDVGWRGGSLGAGFFAVGSCRVDFIPIWNGRQTQSSTQLHSVQLHKYTIELSLHPAHKVIFFRAVHPHNHYLSQITDHFSSQAVVWLHLNWNKSDQSQKSLTIFSSTARKKKKTHTHTKPITHKHSWSQLIIYTAHFFSLSQKPYNQLNKTQ